MKYAFIIAVACLFGSTVEAKEVKAYVNWARPSVNGHGVSQETWRVTVEVHQWHADQITGKPVLVKYRLNRPCSVSSHQTRPVGKYCYPISGHLRSMKQLSHTTHTYKFDVNGQYRVCAVVQGGKHKVYRYGGWFYLHSSGVRCSNFTNASSFYIFVHMNWY